MARSLLPKWSAVGVTLGVLFAAACGGNEETNHGGVDYGSEGGTTHRQPVEIDKSCSPVGALRECTQDIVVNGVKSCFSGLAVCLGEEGWSVCKSTEDALELSESVKAEAAQQVDGAGGAGAEDASAAAGTAGAGS